MKHGSNVRRGRSRNNNNNNNPNRRPGSSRNSTFESNGPNVKIRGTAQQVQEKYIALARDASSAGDRILAEGYLQFAEHYYRIASAAEAQNGGQQQNRPASPQSFDDRGEDQSGGERNDDGQDGENPNDDGQNEGGDDADEAVVIIAAPAAAPADTDDVQEEGGDDRRGDNQDDDRGHRAAAPAEGAAPRRPRRRTGPRNRPAQGDADGNTGADTAPEVIGV